MRGLVVSGVLESWISWLCACHGGLCWTGNKPGELCCAARMLGRFSDQFPDHSDGHG